MKSHTYNHKEAFCLMTYLCLMCKHCERIWNSRDGITPFCLRCPSCGEIDLTHVNWYDDICMPDYVLNPYQRFFRDGTESEARTAIEKGLISLQGTPDEIPRNKWSEHISHALKYEFYEGWPMIDIRLPGKTYTDG